MGDSFGKKLNDLLALITPKGEAQLLEKLQNHLNDPTMQLRAIIKYNRRGNENKTDIDYPLSILETAWAIHALIKVCPVPEIRLLLRDYFTDVIMKSDADEAIFPTLEK